MRGVDHDPLRFAALARQFGEELVEHAQAAPADEPVVDCLVRAIVGRSVAPTQPVLDHKDDGADDPTIVDPRSHATAGNTVQSDASEPATAKTNQPWRSLLASPVNQQIDRLASTLTGPEPSATGFCVARYCERRSRRAQCPRSLRRGERPTRRRRVPFRTQP